MERLRRLMFTIVFLVPFLGCAQTPPIPIVPALPSSERLNVVRCAAPAQAQNEIPRLNDIDQPVRPLLGAPTALDDPRGQDAKPAVQPEKDAKPGVQPTPPPKSAEFKSINPKDVQITLKVPPLEATDVNLPINLAAALRLADDRPLIVAAAQASVWIAEAQLARAKVLWVPTLNFAADYIRHDGFGPDLNHGQNTAANPLNQNLNFFYAGGGLTQWVNLTDAIFEPLAARQYLQSRRWDIQTAKNDALLQTAVAYFNVHEQRGKYAGALDVVERGRNLVELITEQSKDFVPRIEIDRAKNALADFEQRAASAREEWRVQSANLTQVLRLDPRAVVTPIEHDHAQITLVDPARPLDELVPLGLTYRPELASQQALVQAVLVRIRQEKLRPVLPSVVLNGFQTPGFLTQFGIFGLGSDKSMNNWSFRDDFNIQFIWQLEGLGFGNLARIKKQRGDYSRNVVELFKAQDAVAQEVTASQAQIQSAAVRVLQADRALREAIITYDGNYEGLRQTKQLGKLLIQVYRPLEGVTALEHLKLAYDDYFMSVADYNRAQFRLFHSLGYPAREIEVLRTPGEPMPIDTNRPGFMPPVQIGPPPATR